MLQTPNYPFPLALPPLNYNKSLSQNLNLKFYRIYLQFSGLFRPKSVHKVENIVMQILYSKKH